MASASDKTMNYAISGSKEIGDVTASASAFVDNYRAAPDKFNPHAPQFSAAGGSLGLSHVAGHAASVTGQHIPTFGNQLTATATTNLLDTNHRVDVNAFSTLNVPKGPCPAFQTHGGGIDYQFKDKFNAGASVARTPMFKQTDYSVSSGINLHRTPTSSLDLNVGVSRTDTQFGRGNLDKRVFLGFKKTF